MEGVLIKTELYRQMMKSGGILKFISVFKIYFTTIVFSDTIAFCSLNSLVDKDAWLIVIADNPDNCNRKCAAIHMYNITFEWIRLMTTK